MRYFTIYVTQGGYLKVVSKRDEKHAFDGFSRLVTPPNHTHEPPIWALCVKVGPAQPSAAEVCKVFGDIP